MACSLLECAATCESKYAWLGWVNAIGVNVKSGDASHVLLNIFLLSLQGSSKYIQSSCFVRLAFAHYYFRELAYRGTR